MAFKPRLTAPSYSDKWWIHVSAGGVNPCIVIESPSVLPNCVGYAWGRFSEIMGKPAALPTSDAGRWWEDVGNTYKKGKEPKVGAVIVWGVHGDSGHVAVVEKVYPDKSIETSNSAYGGDRFYTQRLYPPDYTWSSAYYFKGFIYNPSVSGGAGGNPQEDFVQFALKHVGYGPDWARGAAGMKTQGPWSMAFVLACAKNVEKVLNVVIANVLSISMMVAIGVKNGSGEYVKGPFFGVPAPRPQVGDLILFRTNKKSAYSIRSEEYADRIGIVTEVTPRTVKTIEGDSDNKVRKHEYDLTWTAISGYYRPKWNKVEGAIIAGETAGNIVRSGPLYQTQSTAEDAAIREVAYASNIGSPFLTSTPIRLSTINYTSLLGAIVDTLGGVGPAGGSTVNTDGITNRNAKIICDFLLDRGLTAAQAIGVLACVQGESSFQTNAVNPESGASGICQWLGSRKTAMIAACGSNWASNLSGQLEFLWTELNSTEKSAFQALTSIKGDSVAIAQQCAVTFSDLFERPGDDEGIREIRRKYARDLWSQIVVTQTTGSTPQGSSIIRTSSGKTLNRGTEILIPTSVRQTGITGNYTNYVYFYDLWARGTLQQNLALTWNSKGRKSNRNISTIDGYYLCAVVPKIGRVGDIITIVLDDNTQINAIIGDAKGSDAGSEWGHYLSYGGGQAVDIIEWEKQGGYNVSIDLTGWSGKKVKKVINYGSYFN